MKNITYVHSSKKPCLAKVTLHDNTETQIDYVVGIYTASNSVNFVDISGNDVITLNTNEYKKIVFVPHKKEK